MTTTNYQGKAPLTIPGFPKSWTFGLQLIVLVIVLGVIGTGVYFGYPYLGKGNKADLRGGMNNFSGFAPGIWMNGGAAPSKESRMYKEFGLTFEAVRMDDIGKLNDALKNGDLDFIFTTTDISPIGMDRSSDLAKVSVAQFLKIDDSRGADVFIVDQKIKTIEDLRGKTIACALGWPSNTLLHATLEAGGLTEKDVKILPMADPALAMKAYISGNADATVVWSPDDQECLKSRPSRVLTDTKLMPNIIMDGFVAKKDVLEKKHDAFVKFAKAWLTANAEMSNPSNMEKAAQTYKIAFGVPGPASEILDGMKLIHFATYGDNMNFFGLSTDFTGITGQQLYTKMARVYKNSYGNNLSNVVPWAEASYPNVVQAVTGLDGGMHSAEGQIKFAPVTTSVAAAPAIVTKRLTVNFATNSFVLTGEEKYNIDREIGGSTLELAGFRIRIEGNTDDTGDRQFNIELSKKRAKAVADYLIAQYEFDSDRFIIVGNGPDNPVSSNDTETGRAANRRTDFEFINK